MVFRFLILILLVASACAEKAENNNNNTLEQPWLDLIVNNSLEGWHIYQDDGTKSGWSVVNGELIFDSVSGLESGAADASLLSDKQYKDFEVKLEWKVTPGANSGFMWGVQEDEKFEFPYNTGPEIQIIDSEVYQDQRVKGGASEELLIAEDLEKKLHIAGALYDMSPPDTLVTKPADTWNSYHITINQTKNEGVVIHNGVLINSFPLHGDLWVEMISNSKFKEWEGFGTYSTGSICLQDHPGKVSFRNIKIREL